MRLTTRSSSAITSLTWSMSTRKIASRTSAARSRCRWRDKQPRERPQDRQQQNRRPDGRWSPFFIAAASASAMYSPGSIKQAQRAFERGAARVGEMIDDGEVIAAGHRFHTLGHALPPARQQLRLTDEFASLGGADHHVQRNRQT